MLAQFSDDFSSGNLDLWMGEIEKFEVNSNNQLQLNASEAGTALIYRNLSFPDSLVWRFDISLSFSPSVNNGIDIILASEDALTNENALLLSIAESGSTDALRLVQIEEAIPQELARGRDGLVAGAFNFRLEISLDGNGTFRMEVIDLDDNSTMTDIELTLEDSLLDAKMSFGFLCRYTSSNTSNFVFDNISVSELIPDTTAPQLLSSEYREDGKVILQYSELLDSSSLSMDNFELIPQLQISSIEFQEGNSASICLNLSEEADACISYSLLSREVQDKAGNKSEEEETGFKAPRKAGPRDILINEVLFDPIGNGSDFVEIINPGSVAIHIENLILRNDSKDEEDLVGNLILEPGELLVICDDALDIIERYNMQAGVRIIEQGIPSFNNASGNFTIISETGSGDKLILDSFDYDESYHAPELEDTEGVSLERILFAASSSDSENWNSSLDITSASPGKINSQSQFQAAFTARIQNSNEIKLYFKERPLAETVTDPNNYNINGLRISDIFYDEENPNILIVLLQDELQSGQVYNLILGNALTSCGDDISGSTENIRLVETPEASDVLISEILFNPFPGENDYLEFFNNSQKFLSLENCSIINALNGDSESINQKILAEPGSIFALSKDPDQVIESYNPPDTANIYSQELPAFNDGEGSVIFLCGSDTLDTFSYTEDMHFQFLRDPEGVSLERISYAVSSSLTSNWTSSAEVNNFGTPGYKNSAELNPGSSEEPVFLEHKAFSPNGDGFKDFLIINYNLDKAGYLATVRLFDDHGRQERFLADNELVSGSGFIKWDGSLEDGRIGPAGIYIIHYEFFHPEGDHLRGKLVTVLAQELK